MSTERYNPQIEKEMKRLVISTESAHELKKMKNTEIKVTALERKEFIKLLDTDK
jgi:hypothetical protein